jgi:hypothetical protein
MLWEAPPLPPNTLQIQNAEDGFYAHTDCACLSPETARSRPGQCLDPCPSGTARPQRVDIDPKRHPTHHCLPDEQVVYSCTFETRHHAQLNAQILSLCASKDATATKGWMFLRLGWPGTVEVQVLDTKKAPAKAFAFSAVRPRPREAREQWTIVHDGVEHILSGFRYKGMSEVGYGRTRAGQAEVNASCSLEYMPGHPLKWAIREHKTERKPDDVDLLNKYDIVPR